MASVAHSTKTDFRDKASIYVAGDTESENQHGSWRKEDPEPTPGLQLCSWAPFWKWGGSVTPMGAV